MIVCGSPLLLNFTGICIILDLSEMNDIMIFSFGPPLTTTFKPFVVVEIDVNRKGDTLT